MHTRTQQRMITGTHLPCHEHAVHELCHCPLNGQSSSSSSSCTSASESFNSTRLVSACIWKRVAETVHQLFHYSIHLHQAVNSFTDLHRWSVAQSSYMFSSIGYSVNKQYDTIQPIVSLVEFSRHARPTVNKPASPVSISWLESEMVRPLPGNIYWEEIEQLHTNDFTYTRTFREK